MQYKWTCCDNLQGCKTSQIYERRRQLPTQIVIGQVSAKSISCYTNHNATLMKLEKYASF
jgi:hypothetical protein